jgi:hypothetical protein
LYSSAACQVAHVLDASWWFNRNLLIITNIERQFLSRTDVREIHCYFEKHPDPTMLDQHRIHRAFGIAVTAVGLMHHVVKRVYSLIGTSNEKFEAMSTMPYAVFVLCSIVLVTFYVRERKVYSKLRSAYTDPLEE